jgi:hypothetical protein
MQQGGGIVVEAKSSGEHAHEMEQGKAKEVVVAAGL